jgi:hypothetical protein
MTTTTSHHSISLSVRLYRALLIAYPKAFRDEYGYDMVQVFRTAYRAHTRTGSWLSIACFWLATLTDFAITVVEEWFADNRGPRRFLRALVIGALAGLIGGVIAGLGARVAMRGVADAIGQFPIFTLEGTLFILFSGAIMGVPFGVIYMALRSLAPDSGAWNGLAYGALLFAVFLAPSLLFYREGEAALGDPWRNVLLFAPIPLVYGLVVQIIVARLETHENLVAHSSAHHVTTALPQAVWFAIFVAVLELAVLGMASISSSGIPIGVLRAFYDIGVPLHQNPEVNPFLLNLFALGYFGGSSLIFWQRARARMARFAALTLLLFGGALFNTGADYYTSLVADTDTLKPFFHAIQVLGCSGLLTLLCLFPHGQFALRWTRWLLGAWSLWALVWWLMPTLPEAFVFAVFIGFLGAGLGAQAQHYHAATPESRAQLRWPLIGFTIAIAGFALVAVLLNALPEFRPYNISGLSTTGTFSLYLLPWLCIPLSLGYAMRRHRLWQASPSAKTV